MIDLNIVIGSLVWLLHASFAGLLARALVKRFALDSPGANATLFVLLWVFVVSLNVLLFGLVGWLTTLAFAVISVAGIGAMLLAAGPARWTAGIRADWRAVGRVLRRAWHALPGWLQAVSIAFIVGGLLRFAALSAFAGLPRQLRVLGRPGWRFQAS